MNVTKCENGHFYDADKYQECPHCGSKKTNSGVSQETNKMQSSAEVKTVPEKTMGKTFGMFDEPKPIVENNISKPVAVASFAKPMSYCPKCGKEVSSEKNFCRYCGFKIKKDAEDNHDNNEIKELKVIKSPVQEEQINEERQEKISLQESVRNAVSGTEGKTVGFFSVAGKSSETTNPVVGWIVCTKGNHFGESFKISGGKNSIGRGISNDIVIANDNTVSREKQLWITYEPKKREFYLQPGDGSGLTYLNGDLVMETKKMTAKDKLEIGEGEYLFVPLCNEEFSWDDFVK